MLWGSQDRRAQARGMREQVQNMGAKQAALQAHNSTLAGEVERWKALWRQSASANQDLTQRLASRVIDQQVGLPAPPAPQTPHAAGQLLGAPGCCCSPQLPASTC